LDEKPKVKILHALLLLNFKKFLIFPRKIELEHIENLLLRNSTANQKHESTIQKIFQNRVDSSRVIKDYLEIAGFQTIKNL